MNDQQRLFESLGRLEERSKVVDERTERIAADLSAFKDLALTRVTDLERRQNGASAAFDQQRALCKQRLDATERRHRPWYLAIVSLVVGVGGGLLSRFLWRT